MRWTSIPLTIVAVALIGCGSETDAREPAATPATSLSEPEAAAAAPAGEGRTGNSATETSLDSEYERRFGSSPTRQSIPPPPQRAETPELRREAAPNANADALARVPRQLGGDHTDASGSDVTIAISGYRLRPLVVRAGTTVRWVNEDAAPHTITAADGSFDSPEFGSDDETIRHFADAGSFSIVCRIHPDMVGVVTVVP